MTQTGWAKLFVGLILHLRISMGLKLILDYFCMIDFTIQKILKLILS